MSGLDRPTEGDVIDLILADHVAFETLLRELRDASADREQARRDLATLHVAHAEAEERKVYPRLRRRGAVDEDEVEHGEHEHAEGHEALLAVLEAEQTSGDDFDEAVEDLTAALSHHLAEEELTILNPARDEVPEDERRELGAAFCAERNRLVDEDCGTVENVRRLVEDAKDRDLLDD
ncbi:MAG: hemerythrin domain-containing protein [Aeromicrobium erythreum]